MRQHIIGYDVWLQIGRDQMNPLLFDMNLLKVLSVLLEERSVTRTAKRLGRTQSAISNSLKKLRDALEDPLFVRGPDGLIPTPKARILEKRVHSIIRATNECLAGGAVFDPAAASGRIRVGAPDRISLPVLLPLIERIHQNAPNLALDITTTDREEALGLLDADQLDMAIGWIDNPPLRFNSEFLFQEGFVCLCRRGHPLVTHDKAADLATILSYPHLMVSAAADPRAVFDLILARTGRRRNTMISVSNFTMVPSILRSGDMVGVFTQRVAKVLAKDSELVALPVMSEVEPLDHFMVWHNRNDADQLHLWVRELVRRVAKI